MNKLTKPCPPVGRKIPPFGFRSGLAAGRCCRRYASGTKVEKFKLVAILILGAIMLAPNFAFCEVMTEAQLSEWMAYYYLNPAPDEVPTAIAVMRRDAVFANDEAYAGVTSFLSVIFAANPERLSGWVDSLNDLTTRESQALASSLWLAGTEQARESLTMLAERGGDEPAPFIQELLETPVTPIETFEITTVAILYMLWGAFTASGAEIYVERIISALPYREVRDDTTKLAIGGAAMWSLTAVAIQHDKVFDICVEQKSVQKPDIAKFLDEILSTATEKQRGPDV